MINQVKDVDTICRHIDNKFLKRYYNGIMHDNDLALSNSIKKDTVYDNKYSEYIGKDNIVIREVKIDGINKLKVQKAIKEHYSENYLTLVFINPLDKESVYACAEINTDNYIFLNIYLVYSDNYISTIKHELMHIVDSIHSKYIFRQRNSDYKEDEYLYRSSVGMRYDNNVKKIDKLLKNNKISDNYANDLKNSLYYNSTIEVRARFIEFLEDHGYALRKLNNEEVINLVETDFPEYQYLNSDVKEIIKKRAIIFANRIRKKGKL